jgi:hypothetical protein
LQSALRSHLMKAHPSFETSEVAGVARGLRSAPAGRRSARTCELRPPRSAETPPREGTRKGAFSCIALHAVPFSHELPDGAETQRLDRVRT